MVFTIIYNTLGDNLNDVTNLQNQTDQEIHIKLSSCPQTITNEIISTDPQNCIDSKNVKLFKLTHSKLSSNTIFFQIQHFRQLRELNLSNNNLTSIPSVILDLNSLQKLNVSNNNIGNNICSDFNRLSALTSFNCSNNNMTELPTHIYFANTLEELNISHNKIKKISKQIKHLTSLKILLVNDNTLLNLPNNLHFLNRLETLWFHNNQIGELPITIVFLSNIQSLTFHNNQIINYRDDMRINRYLQQINQKNYLNLHKQILNFDLNPIKKIIKNYGQNYVPYDNTSLTRYITTPAINIFKVCCNNPIIYQELQCNFSEIAMAFFAYIDDLNECMKRYIITLLNENIIRSNLMGEIYDNIFINNMNNMNNINNINNKKDRCNELLIFVRTLEQLHPSC